jgi:site-specific recombinase XerD
LLRIDAKHVPYDPISDENRPANAPFSRNKILLTQDIAVTEPTSADLLAQYKQTLTNKAPGTVDGYMRALRKLIAWISQRPGSEGQFKPAYFTQTAVETYLEHLRANNYSPSHQILVKSAASGFARWLIDEKGLLHRNPTRGVQVQSQSLLAPRVLTPDQRYVLRNLIERHADRRGSAIFALGFWAGCRVSDVSWLTVKDTHVSQRQGWLTVGHKGGKKREIDLAKAARQPLYEYLQWDRCNSKSPYTFTSQRAERLTEAGIHHWFRALKGRATKAEWDLIQEVTFHDFRHDFAHRAREAGWTLEEVAYYLGHITRKGTPALQTTVRYTQASREQVKTKLDLLAG